MHTFCRRRKSTAEPLGRSPGSEGRESLVPIREPLHLPRLTAEWLFEAASLRSQWRDRAGFAPDFPVMPLVGTQGEQKY